VGIELIHANDPKTFHGVIFIRNQNIANIMTSYYEKLWEFSLDDISYIASEASGAKTFLSPSTK